MTCLSASSYLLLERAAIWCALVTVFLASVPLHGLDDLLTMPFYGSSGFILRGNGVVELLHNYAGKAPPALAALWFLRVALFPRNVVKVNTISPRKAALYALLAMLLSIVLVGLLKKLTGMNCPWDLKIYGGNAEHSVPLYEMLQGNFSGHCWPSGYSGGIFSVYAWCFYLCLRGKSKRVIILSFTLITALGLLGGVLQMARGAHFPSHIIAAMTFDYALCFFIMSGPLKRAAASGVVKSSDEG